MKIERVSQFLMAFFACAAAAAAAGTPAAASAPPSAPTLPFRENVGVSLVEVPVTVLDSAGKPVRGLQASDFRVLDDGKDVSLEAVDVDEFESAHPAEAPKASNPVGIRRFLLLFDLSFVTSAELTRARDAASRFVSKTMGSSDLAAVASVSTKEGPKMLSPFAPRGTALTSAIAALRANAPFRRTVTISGDDDASGKGQFTDDEIDRMQQPGDAHDAASMGNLVESLAAVGESLRAIPGRKQIIYFSQGFELMGDGTRLLSPLHRALEQLRRDDCIVHTVDIGGLKAGRADMKSSMGMSDNDVLADMAKETGGEFLANSNDFASQIGRVLEATSVVYVLTFRPSATGHPGQYHRLEVKVARNGARLFARPGYYEVKPL